MTDSEYKIYQCIFCNKLFSHDEIIIDKHSETHEQFGNKFKENYLTLTTPCCKKEIQEDNLFELNFNN